MATARVSSPLDDALKILERENPQAASLIAKRLAKASQDGDQITFRQIAANAIQIAESLVRDTVQPGAWQHAEPKHAKRTATAKAPQPGIVGGLIAAGCIAIAVGVISWIIGAWYSLKGWVLGLNLVLAIVGAEGRIAIPTSWYILLFIPLGIGYSFMEVRLRPRKSLYQWLFREVGWYLLVVFGLLYLFVIGTDLGSTYLSVTTPNADSWTITKQIAASPWAASGWTGVLTFLPEGFIVLGTILLRKAWASWSN